MGQTDSTIKIAITDAKAMRIAVNFLKKSIILKVKHLSNFKKLGDLEFIRSNLFQMLIK
jgi:hypothetical protein